MVDSIAVVYPHRKKMDGSSNVLCLNCLATIEMEQNAPETIGDTQDHICSPWLLQSGRFPDAIVLPSRGNLQL
jgi:hypothetical protein